MHLSAREIKKTISIHCSDYTHYHMKIICTVSHTSCECALCAFHELDKSQKIIRSYFSANVLLTEKSDNLLIVASESTNVFISNLNDSAHLACNSKFVNSSAKRLRESDMCTERTDQMSKTADCRTRNKYARL